MKCSNLTLIYNDFDLQLTSIENVLGVNIDDNLTWTGHFQNVAKKFHQAFVSAKI